MLVAAVAGHDLDDLTLTTWLTDVGALNDDSVTPIGVHGEPPLSEVCLRLYSYRARRRDGTASGGCACASGARRA
jgi:hypothetical protein